MMKGFFFSTLFLAIGFDSRTFLFKMGVFTYLKKKSAYKSILDPFMSISV